MRNIVFALIVAAFVSLAGLNTGQTSTAQEGCGEVAGIEEGATYVDVCATVVQTISAPTPTPSTTVQQTSVQPTPEQIEQSRSFAVGEEPTQPNNGYGITNGIAGEKIYYPDTDGDGWSDASELEANLEMGGSVFNPADPHDMADIAGSTIPSSFVYPDGSRRYPDCAIDAMDAQVISFRWGTSRGDLIYKDSQNLEPRYGSGYEDDDIDINDLQYVFGRFGLACSAQQGVVPLSNYSQACNGNFREAAEEVIEDYAPPSVECLLIRDSQGTLVDLIEVSGSTESGEVAAICSNCTIPGQSETGDWFTTSVTEKRTHKWPPCAFGVCSPWRATVAELRLYCTWSYFDGPPSHPYDGAVVDEHCKSYATDNEPWEWITPPNGPVAWRNIPGTFTKEARVEERFTYDVGALYTFQNSTYIVECEIGPWNQKFCWHN